MLRDIERGGPTEGATVLGDMQSRARRYGVPTPLLDLAWTHLATYEQARTAELAAREAAPAAIDLNLALADTLDAFLAELRLLASPAS